MKRSIWRLKEHHLRENDPSDTAMHSTGLKDYIYSEANQRGKRGDIGLATILSTDDRLL